MMREAVFRGLVTRAVGQLPERIFDGVKNVAVLVRSVPDQEQRRVLRRAHALLGLYEGVPQIDRLDPPLYPDRITLFQRAIEVEAHATGERVIDVIRATLIHEIGHHLGLTDRDLRRLKRRATERTDAVSPQPRRLPGRNNLRGFPETASVLEKRP